MTGPWIGAHVRSKSYRVPGVHRLQISLDGGDRKLTLYVVHLFGFAIAIHLPKRLTQRLLATTENT